ncbi:hypothetical protein Plec18170_007332 [Paecilomyces lecythidis]
MGQYWIICCMDTRQTMPTFGGKMGEFLFDCSPGHMTDLLAVPVLPQRLSPRFKRVATVHSPFSNLPAELHDLIFQNLDILDAVSLGLTNGYFFNLAERHVHAAYMSLLGQWAGKRIICIGDDIDDDDWPSWFSEEDKRHFLLKESERSKNPDDDPVTPYGIMDRNTTVVKLYSELIQDVRLHLEGMQGCLITKDGQLYNSMEKTFCPPLQMFYPEDQPWILRNLATREFVRAEAVALKKEHVHGPDIDFRGFGEVVVSRIPWSSSSSVQMINTTNMHRGVWAGHRLDIVTVEKHETDLNGEEWKDVSDEVKKELHEIWSNRLGDDGEGKLEETLTRWKVGTTRRVEGPLILPYSVDLNLSTRMLVWPTYD